MGLWPERCSLAPREKNPGCLGCAFFPLNTMGDTPVNCSGLLGSLQVSSVERRRSGGYFIGDLCCVEHRLQVQEGTIHRRSGEASGDKQRVRLT